METPASPATPSNRPRWWASEDWIAIALAAIVLGASLAAAWFSPSGAENPLAGFIAKTTEWTGNPARAFPSPTALVATLGIALALFALGVAVMGGNALRFAVAFVGVFLLTSVSLIVAAQAAISYYNLEYALWALLLGLAISNSFGTPDWLRPAVRTELYIKTGLVLLGATMLFTELMTLGPKAMGVAWVVTPVVLVTTYWFGQKVLKIESRSLNMVVSADMSVCGVSAAIATAGACRAKKEELSLAISISLTFTVVMMIVMPWVVKAAGIDPMVGGAWIGGTIDSTGAVAAAGEMISREAGTAAITIKMVQNMLIGVTAFCVAVYWVTYVDRSADATTPRAREIWDRFPKFVLGFLAASLLFSLISAQAEQGPETVAATLGATKTLQKWFFALAFVSIGLESNFRELARYLRGGKPVVLYACGQTLNLTLTLLMAWWLFSTAG